MPCWRDLFSFGLHCYWAVIFQANKFYCFIGWLTNSVVLSLDDFLLIACHVYTLCFLGCHTSLGYIPIPIADQAAKWGWWFFIILFHFNTRFISSRIWRATIHIESHLKSDDSYRVAFEERRFISSRVWRATIPYRVALFRKAILVTVGLWGCLFAVIFVRTFAEACRNHSIACLKTSIDSFSIILRWSDLLARRRDHLSWDASDHFSFARCGRSFVARCEQSWLGWCERSWLGWCERSWLGWCKRSWLGWCERSWLGWCEWSGLACTQLQEWPKTIAIFGEGVTDDCYSAKWALQLCSVGHPLFSSIKIILMLFFERRLSEARQR